MVDQDAHAADRKKVPAEAIQVASYEVDTDSDKDESIVATSDSEGSDASESEQNDPSSSLASDAEQYERMQASYTAVGRDFNDKEALSGLSTTSSSVWSWFLNFFLNYAARVITTVAVIGLC